MRARARLAVVAALSLLVATALAVLAHGVFAVARDVETADAALAQGALGFGGSKSLPFRAAEDLLAAGDDRSYRDAVRLLRTARIPDRAARAVAADRAEARVLLTRLALEADDAALRAGASNLLGILLFEEATAEQRSRRRNLELSFEAFRTAVTAGDLEDAKFNLEVLAKLLSSGAEAGAGGGTGKEGTRGAALSPAGSGY